MKNLFKKPYIARLALRGGVHHVGWDKYNRVRKFVTRVILHPITRKSMFICDLANRNTLFEKDIYHAEKSKA